MLEKLKRLIPDKELMVIKAIMESDHASVAFDFRRFDSAFNGYSCGVAPDGKLITAERHLLNMFKILFTMGGMVYVHMLPLLTTMYMLRTRNSLPKPTKVKIKSNSVYAKVIGIDVFNVCLNRYKLVYATIVNSSLNVPIDAERGVVLSLSYAESTKYFPGERITAVIGSDNESKWFNHMLNQKHRAFIVSPAGVLCPILYYESGTETREDL